MMKRVLLAAGLVLVAATTAAMASGHGGAPADASWLTVAMFEVEHHLMHMGFTLDAIVASVASPQSVEASLAWATVTDSGCTSLSLSAPTLFGTVPAALLSFFATMALLVTVLFMIAKIVVQTVLPGLGRKRMIGQRRPIFAT